jgi:hypothetical protein
MMLRIRRGCGEVELRTRLPRSWGLPTAGARGTAWRRGSPAGGVAFAKTAPSDLDAACSELEQSDSWTKDTPEKLRTRLAKRIMTEVANGELDLRLKTLAVGSVDGCNPSRS